MLRIRETHSYLELIELDTNRLVANIPKEYADETVSVLHRYLTDKAHVRWYGEPPSIHGPDEPDGWIESRFF